MRKISVDIFFCSRRNVRKAINEYLNEVKSFDGIIGPNTVFLGHCQLNHSFNSDTPVYRIFSVQRRGSGEVKVVVNLSSKCKS